MTAHRPARVWVDLTNTAHVVVLRPLVELLEARGAYYALYNSQFAAAIEEDLEPAR